MPTDPRMVAAASSPNAAPVSAAALTNVYNALLDLSRRIDRVEASRTTIQADTITSTHIAAGAIHASEIEVGNIVASIMTVGAVNASHIDASSIRASVLDAAVLTAGNAFITSLRASILDAGILTATNATIGTLRASIINGTQIVAQNLQAQVLTAVNAAITNLSSFNVSTGTLTADLLRSAASGARVEIGATAGGIKGYNSGGTMTFGFDTTTGAATVGAITVTGASGTSVPASTLTGFVGGGNLLKDSSFESADPALPAGLWSLSNATMAKSTTQSFHGTTSLRVTYGSTTNSFVFTDLVAKHDVPVTSLRSRPLVVSAWVWVDTTATTLAGLDRTLVAFDNTGASAVALASNLTKGQWNRVVVKMTPGAAATFVDIALTAAYSNGPIYYDGVQVEFGDAATAYNPKADEIVYGKITTTMLSVGAVDATSIGAGAIDGKTITGATVRTSAGSSRLEMNGTDGLFITIDNAVTKDFQLTSAGLAFTAGATSTPVDQRKIRWLNGSLLTGEILNYESAVASGTYVRAFTNAAGRLANAQLTAYGLGISGSSSFNVSARDTVNTDCKIDAVTNGGTGGGSVARLYQDATGRSNFVQIGTASSPVKAIAARGTATITLTTGGGPSGSVIVNHGMVDPNGGSGIAPIVVLATSDNSSYVVGTNSFGTTSFQIVARHAAGTALNTTLTITWIAVS